MKRVLIVDDHPEILDLLRVQLEGEGLEVGEATNGAEALRRARLSPPDLLISDLLMPVMDGYTLLRHWKLDERLKHVPFIAHTATYTEAKDEDLATGLGADAFVLKQAGSKPLLEQVRALLLRKQAREPADLHGSETPLEPLVTPYSEVLVRKLEAKCLRLEQVNRALEVEMAERRKVEAAMRFQAHLLSQIGEAVIATEVDGTIIYANRLAEKLYGWTAAEMVGRHVFDLTAPPASHDQAMAIMERLNLGEVWSGELPVQRRDGTLFPAAFRYTPIRDSMGCLTAMVGISADITEKRRTEQKLAESERRLRTIFETEPECVKLLGPNCSLLEMNPAGLRMIEADSLLEVVGKSVLGLIVPENRAAFAALSERVLHGESGSLRYEIQGLKGTHRWLETHAVPMAGATGEIVSALSITRDITERREAEEALAHSDRRFRALLERSADSISIIDADNNILYLSPAVTAVEGYTREELQGRNGLELTHPDDVAHVQATVARLMDHPGEPIPVLWRRKHKDGHWLWLEGVATNFLHDPAVGGIVTNYRDVTARKRAEAEIRQLNAELEHRVEERTRELEEKTRQMESFTYSVSHDLKAPLRAIDGYSGLLLRDYGDRFDDDAREFLKNIRRGSAQMTQLIEDLLAYSRLERYALAVDSINLREFVQTMLERRKEDLAKVQVTVEIGELRVAADPEGLGIALRNLIDNAVKFSAHQAKPELYIGASAPEGRCTIVVRDNGAGFDMRYHDRIFEIFQRLHRAEDYPGTGVGLAMVRKAAELMHGRVWAQSAPDAGATFCLQLPLAEVASAPLHSDR